MKFATLVSENKMATAKPEVVITPVRNHLEKKFQQLFSSTTIAQYKGIATDTKFVTPDLKNKMAAAGKQKFMKIIITRLMNRLKIKLLQLYLCYNKRPTRWNSFDTEFLTLVPEKKMATTKLEVVITKWF